MPGSPIVTAAVLIIGNEILSGRTRDVNLPYLAEQLNAAGVRLREARVVADLEEDIVRAVNECRARYDHVFTTGGIGPTHDDITAQCVAKAFGVPLTLHPEGAALLERHYGREHLNEARLRMAHTPQGARLIENPVSTAPGFQIGNVYVLAGVPAVMQAMFDGLRGGLRGGAPMRSRTISVHLPEGLVARGLGALQDRYPDIEIGSYPFFRQGRYGTSLVLRGTDEARIGAAEAELRGLVRDLGAEPLAAEPA